MTFITFPYGSDAGITFSKPTTHAAEEAMKDGEPGLYAPPRTRVHPSPSKSPKLDPKSMEMLGKPLSELQKQTRSDPEISKFKFDPNHDFKVGPNIDGLHTVLRQANEQRQLWELEQARIAMDQLERQQRRSAEAGKSLDRLILNRDSIGTKFGGVALAIALLVVALGLFSIIPWSVFKIVFQVVVVVTVVVLSVIMFMPKTALLELPDPVDPVETDNGRAKKLLIFVHGWRGDDQGTWKEFPTFVRTDPRFQDVAILAVHYPTYIVRRGLTIRELAVWMQGELNSEKYSYDELAIIAHSMGGLISREIIILDEVPRRNLIKILVEVATPHLGGNYAGLAAAFGVNVRELEKGSPLLVSLNEQWGLIKDRRPYSVCFTSPSDNFVSEESATYGCDCQSEFHSGSHTALVKPSNKEDPRYQLPMKQVYAGLTSGFETSKAKCVD